jgi:hypothetical protein
MSARGGGGRGASRGGARGGRGGLWIPAKRPRAADDAAPGAALGDPDTGALLLAPLGGTRRAKVFAFSASATRAGEAGALLDIREMYSKEGVPYALPGKKGIALTLEQAEALFAAGDGILAAMRAACGGKEAVAAAAAAAVTGAGGGEPEGGGKEPEDEAAAAAAAAAAAREARKEKKRRKREAEG